jgi:hypothetical protein
MSLSGEVASKTRSAVILRTADQRMKGRFTAGSYPKAIAFHLAQNDPTDKKKLKIAWLAGLSFFPRIFHHH